MRQELKTNKQTNKQTKTNKKTKHKQNIVLLYYSIQCYPLSVNSNFVLLGAKVDPGTS